MKRPLDCWCGRKAEVREQRNPDGTISEWSFVGCVEHPHGKKPQRMGVWLEQLVPYEWEYSPTWKQGFWRLWNGSYGRHVYDTSGSTIDDVIEAWNERVRKHNDMGKVKHPERPGWVKCECGQPIARKWEYCPMCGKARP